MCAGHEHACNALTLAGVLDTASVADRSLLTLFSDLVSTQKAFFAGRKEAVMRSKFGACLDTTSKAP